MKKMILALIGACVFLCPAFVSADTPITKEQLPANSQQFLKKHFPKAEVSLAKLDKGLIYSSYDVILSDGSKVEFSQDGEWKSVECEYSQVPRAIIPSEIMKYVNRNFPNAKVVEIDRDSKDYEVKLNNGIDIKFDKAFRVIDIDD